MRAGLSGVASAASWSMMARLCVILGCSKDTDVVDTTPPAAVTDLAAINTAANSVTLRWTAPADKGTTGNAAKYDVRYATWPITDANWGISTRAQGEPKPKHAGRTDTLVVMGFPLETNYYFALKAADEESNWSASSNVAHAWIWTTTDTIPPSAVEDLAAGNPSDHTVTLTWTAPGDDHDSGTAAQYNVRYSTSPITGASWASASQAADEPSPKAAGAQETFIVAGLASDSTYYFALKTADERSNLSPLSNVANARTVTQYSWSLLGSGMNEWNGHVNALIVFDGQLIAGGHFTTAGDVPAAHIAAWNGSSWSALSSGMSGGYLPWTMALGFYGGQLAAGGNFTITGGLAANHVAAWNGSSWAPLGSGTDAPVSTALVYSNQLIAGGFFNTAGEDLANRIAAWDGTSWSPLGSGMSSSSGPAIVYALTVYNGQLVAAGWFDSTGGVPASNIAVWGN